MTQNFEDFLSFAYSDELTNKDVIERLNHEQFEVYLPSKFEIPPVDIDLSDWHNQREHFFLSLYISALNHELSSIGLKFLEYHYKKFIDKKGNGADFISFILEHLSIRKKFEEERKPPIIRWLDSKWVEQKQIDPEGQVLDELKNKIKVPKLNELNKPNLTQVQISILFTIMKKKNIISNRDLSKKGYAQIIDILTGYSGKKLRQVFSERELLTISDRSEDYQEIIDNLKVIIHELEKEKDKISQRNQHK